MQQTNPFQRASRRKVKLKIALTGPSGSGKTRGALELAQSLGKRVGLIDTENKSASLYSDLFEFDALDINPPYTVAKYKAAIDAAVRAGYDVLIIDSITHAWAGEGGLLSKKEALDATGRGNSYTNWATISKEQEEFKAQLLNSDIHLICTMRSKQDYVLELNDKGKAIPKKVGMAPIQRDGIEYEFTTVFDLATNHIANISKDRTGLFEGFMEKLSAKVGEDLLKWLNSAKEAEPKRPADGGSPAAIMGAPATTQPSAGVGVVSSPTTNRIRPTGGSGPAARTQMSDEEIESQFQNGPVGR